MLQLRTNQLIVWFVIDLLVTFPSLHLRALACPSISKVLQTKERALAFYPSVVFTIWTHSWVYQGVWGCVMGCLSFHQSCNPLKTSSTHIFLAKKLFKGMLFHHKFNMRQNNNEIHLFIGSYILHTNSMCSKHVWHTNKCVNGWNSNL
jgi:hypothetical protein